MPFLIPLVALIVGILAGAFLKGPAWGFLPIGAGLAYYLLLLKKSATPISALKLNSRHSVWIFMLFTGIGMFDAWYHRPMELTDAELSGYAAAQGTVIKADTYASGDRFTVDVSHLAEPSGKLSPCLNLRIILNTDGLNANVGDILLFPVSLAPLEDNPNHRPSGYAEKMRLKGIFYKSRTSADRIIHKGFDSGLRSNAASWRDRIAAKIENSELDRATSEFIIAMTLGDRSLIDPEVSEAFSNAGVAHILALSGMHVAIILGIVLFILFPLKLLGLHILRYWLAIIVLWAYAFFSGMSPSTVRACIMTSFVIMSMSLQRRNASGNALLASAFTILIFDPYSLFDIGMQLSFLCVAAILVFAGPLNTVNRHFHPRLHSCVAATLVSLIATLATWVLISYYFKRIPLLFLPANLIILPFLPVFMGTALFYIAFLLVGIDLHFVASVLDVSYSFIIAAVEWLSAFGDAAVSYQVQLPVVVCWLLGILVIGYALRRRKTMTAYVVGVSFLVGSLILIPVLKTEEPDGVIFQNNHADISVALYDSDHELLTSFPRHAVSRLVHKGCEIVSVDCLAGLDSIAPLIGKAKKGSRKFMVLGSGFKGRSLKEIPGIENFDKVVIHSSMRRNAEEMLLKEAEEAGIKTIHSIRQDGPLSVDF